MTGPHALIWGISALAAAGVILRPWRVPEWVWVALGAALVVLLGLLPPAAAWQGIAKGGDVYLFLIGMMLLAELARREGLFNYLAAHAVRGARGSASRLFGMVYLVAVLVTVFLSNDATAVVLTPAVAAVTRAARVRNAQPYLLVCALTANAASFVLPISNPANLVVYGSRLPPLFVWLPRYALPSALAIAATYFVLRLMERKALRQEVERALPRPRLSAGAALAAGGIGLTSIVLLAASSAGIRLGLPTFLAGATIAATALIHKREPPIGLLRGISWGVLPLVAGLFVLVEALDASGLLRALGGVLQTAAGYSLASAIWSASAGAALLCNLANNLPVALVAGGIAQSGQLSPHLVSGLLIGVDLGPNLSVTGSLATLLWLTALRRDGEDFSPWAFLRLGLVAMPPALLLAIAGLRLSG